MYSQSGLQEGLLLAPSEELRPLAEVFLALRAKKELILLFLPIFEDFWCPVVALVTLSKSLRNFERNAKKKTIKSKKNQKIFLKKIKKSKKSKQKNIYI